MMTIILNHNKGKGGVDTAVQMLRVYSTKSACSRWPMSALHNLLDIVALNAYIVCKDLKICQSNRSNFLFSLCEAFCHRSIEVRRKGQPLPRFQLPLSDFQIPRSRIANAAWRIRHVPFVWSAKPLSAERVYTLFARTVLLEWLLQYLNYQSWVHVHVFSQ